MFENSSVDRECFKPAARKYCWHALAGLLLFGLLLPGACLAQEWGSVGAGYIYQVSGVGGHWPSTHGWYVLPTFNINKQVGVFADFANFYGKGANFVGNDQNIHVELYGVFHGFQNKTKVTPFVFIGPGFIRNSYAGTVTHSFAWCTGAGLTIRLTRWVSFQTIPVEYVMNTANGKAGANFVARAGLALTIPKSR
jgi:hypothetical protein